MLYKEKVCNVCKKKFIPKSGVAKFCDVCVQKKGTHICEKCGARFQGKKDKLCRKCRVGEERTCQKCGRIPVMEGNRFLCYRCFHEASGIPPQYTGQ